MFITLAVHLCRTPISPVIATGQVSFAAPGGGGPVPDIRAWAPVTIGLCVKSAPGVWDSISNKAVINQDLTFETWFLVAFLLAVSRCSQALAPPLCLCLACTLLTSVLLCTSCWSALDCGCLFARCRCVLCLARFFGAVFWCGWSLPA